MSRFEKILKIVKNFEGNDKYTNHPLDPGKGTRFGITQWTYFKNGFLGSVKCCTPQRAAMIYKKMWDKLNLDLINDFFVCLIIFDIRVNGGAPVKWFQRCLNVLNRMGKDYPDLKVDGKIGPVTAGITNRAMKIRRGKIRLHALIYEAFLSLRTTYFIRISEKNKNLQCFLVGWISKRVIKLKNYR